MSDNNVTRRKTYFDEEEVEENSYRVQFTIPKNLKKDDIKIKYKKNGFYVEFIEDMGIKEDGWTYHCTNKGYYTRSFPFVIKNLKGKLESETVVLTFDKSEEASSGHNVLELDSGEE